MKRTAQLILIALFFAHALFCQSHISTQGHRDSVNAIANVNDSATLNKSYFTAGKDGFLIKWSDNNQGEHYQISDLEIKLMALSPNKNDVAVYETNGGLINRVSVWDWKNLKRKYARRFRDSITSLKFSALGTYLIVGTATVDGVIFLKSDTGGVLKKISEDTGIVSMIDTSATEKTAVFYSPTGAISYFNLVTGKLKQKIGVQGGLEQVVLFNNSMCLCGVRRSVVYIINSVNGKTIKQFDAQNPLILSGEKQTDSSIYFLQNDERGNYSLSVVEAADANTISDPKLIKEYRGPRGAAAIVSGSRNSTDLVLGAANGTIYQTDMINYGSTDPLNPLTEDTYEKILDVAASPTSFLFLSKEKVFSSTYEDETVNNFGKNPGYNSLIPYGDKVILYSKDSRQPVVLFDGKEQVILFNPQAAVQSLKLAGNQLLEMEGGSTVNIFDLDSRTKREVYSGTSLQDTIFATEKTTGNPSVYIAKSASTPPLASLLKIDTVTLETVPINLGGNVVFALNSYQNDMFGVSVQVDDNKKNTVVFRYTPLARKKSTVFKLADEDNDAFTYLYYPYLYTNIGKDSVRSYNMSQNKNTVYRRSSSIPQKVCQSGNIVAVLNRDGSLSWYNPGNPSPLSVWYFTKDSQWLQF